MINRSSGAVLALISLFLALPAASCNPPVADAAPVMVAGPSALSGALAPGDSLGPYTFSVAPVSGATGYRWTLSDSATNGVFPGIPTSSNTTSPSITFTLPTGGAWDSVSLRLCVTGTSAVRTAKASACANWKVLRYLPSPTSLSGDSTKLAPMSLMVRTPTGDLPVGLGGVQHSTMTTNGTLQFCTFVRFGSGTVAGLDTVSACVGVAVRSFAKYRLRAVTAQEAAWLAGGCSSWAACALGSIRALPDVLLTHRA